jgi:cytochrome oxidase Cu insertion factor (SCO1/SenC/PrrC family)/thiol-disulfide isomerase/thioredoxin
VTLAVLVVLLSVCAVAGPAWADGDPGSDVLVYQDLFAGPDAGLSVQQQVALGGLLKTASRAGFPIRVAIIASPSDLGSVTALWRKPGSYARFLGLELSLAYKQRLLVVMPNGFGFNWPGHSSASAGGRLTRIQVRPGRGGLFLAAEAAVRALAAANGTTLGSAAPAPVSSGAHPSSGSATGAAASGRGTDNLVAGVALALFVLACLAIAARRVLARRQPGREVHGGADSPSAPADSFPHPSDPPPVSRPRTSRVRRRRIMSGGAVLCGIAVGMPLVLLASSSGSSPAPAPSPSQTAELASNPSLDPGTRLSRPAPDFTLDDQFGHPVSLHSFRGKVVILAFNDSECTTICPLTTQAMLDARAMLGKAASQAQLLGVDANPLATSVEDVLSYSQLHGMLHAWHFLTGSLAQLKQVWNDYAIEAAVERGQITHTQALFVIDSHGREAKVYLTQQSYASIGALGQLLAREVSSLLPGRPPVRSDLSYAPIPGISPTSAAVLPAAGGRTVRIGPGRAPRLYLFFATWDQEVTSLGGHLIALNRYQDAARRSGLPALTAVDEGSVEPSPSALTGFLHRLPSRLSYPVAIDHSGRVADGYEVQGQPWFVLISATGRILYYRLVSAAGWPSQGELGRLMRAALARAPKAPATAAATNQLLAGSPAPLTAIHAQASRLLGSQTALDARIRALRGYPVVVNAWASWCSPCREEFSLFAAASARYGRHVAFLGADTDDSSGDAQTFLAQHPVSYPSYQTTTTDLRSLAVIEGLPTTIFINSAGKVTYVHTGQYDSLGTLDADIGSYAR